MHARTARHQHTRRRLTAAGTLSLLAAAMTAYPVLTTAQAATAPLPATTAVTTSPPQVIPALPDWTAGTGSFSYSARTQIVTTGRHQDVADAKTFAADLRQETGKPIAITHTARAGDIVLRVNPADTALGTEGYAMTIGQKITITGATDAGVFYGTRTVLQLLTSGDTIPAGSTTDVPEYAQRAVGVSNEAGYIPLTWMDNLIRDMAYLKLNTLFLQVKVKSTLYPGVDTFGYYTPAQMRQMVALARSYHITVIPGIDAPGHMDPYITNYPDLQLVNTNGVANPTSLDVTSPAAVTFYENLIGEEMKVVPGPYWELGGDEYPTGSGYSDYPQLLAYAQSLFGPGATAQDAYINFINQVDDYVNAHGRTLVIWNDGLTGANTIPLNKNIVIDYWVPESVTPQQLLDAGYTLNNASDSLYYVRGDYGPNIQSLYDSGWSPLDFAGQTVAAGLPGIEGTTLMVWPDNYGAETLTTTQANLFLPIRFIAQTSWDAGEPSGMSYADFSALATQLGHAPGWQPLTVQPVPSQQYRITTPAGAALTARGSALATTTGAGSGNIWALQATSDGYYQISSDGQCADMTQGQLNQSNVVEQAGAPISLAACNGGPTQKWQLEPVGHGGYQLINAITQEVATVSDGAVVQEPPVGARDDIWRLQAWPSAALTLDQTSAGQGATETVTTTLTETGISRLPLKNVSVTLSAPDGWTVTATTPSTFATVRPGQKAQTTWTVTSPADAPEPIDQLTANASYAVQGRPATAAATGYVSSPVQAPYLTYTSSQATAGQLGSQFEIIGGGELRWPTAAANPAEDEYGAIYQPGAETADSVTTVEVSQQSDTSPYALAGIMVRNDIADPTSPGFVMLAVTPGYGAVIEWDSNGDGILDSSRYAFVTTTYPTWLKLVRDGTTYTGYYSTDGTTWTELTTPGGGSLSTGSITVPSASATQDVGMFQAASTFVAGQSTSVAGEADFENFTTSGS